MNPFVQSQNAQPGATSYGAIFATLATILGVLLPFVPPQYMIFAQAGVAGLGAAATKLP
jgi:hypothetical protein